VNPDTKLIGALLGLLAHDLRNPLSALQSNASFLESVNGIDGDGRDAISDLMVACDGLNLIIDNLDLLGRSLRPPEPSPRRAQRVEALVSDTVQRCARLAVSHGVDVVVDLPVELSGVAVGSHGDGVAKALANLLQNSLQHGPYGSKVVLSAERREPYVVIRVLDTGTRVDPDSADVAFSMEGQIHSKSTGCGRYGRGLGLYAAAECAKSGGASVKIGNGPGNCNCFELICQEAS